MSSQTLNATAKISNSKSFSKAGKAQTSKWDTFFEEMEFERYGTGS